MKKALVALSFCVAMVSFAAGAQTQERSAKVKRLDEIASFYAKQGRFMGTVLVADGNDVLLSKGYGYANLEWQNPQQPDAEFHLASLSKQFTAAAVLLLQEDGKLKVREPISRYLPNLPEAWKSLTVDNLLTHTSGLKEMLDDPRFNTWSMVPHTVPEQMAFIHDYPLGFVPGTKFVYCNTDYVLLAMIVEAVSGARFRDVLQQRFFTKLGMNHTGTDTDALILPHRAQGYRRGPGGFERIRDVAFSVSIVDGGAGVYSSTTDLLIWQQALFGGKILSPASVAYMTHRGLGNYGAGEANNTRHGETVIEHAGGMEGFSTTLSYIPDRKLTVAVLSNVERAPEWVIAGQIMDVMLGDPVSLGKDAPSLPEAAFKELPGVYTSPVTAPDVPFKLSVVDQRVYLQRGEMEAALAVYEGTLGNSMRFIVPDYDAEFQVDITGKTPTMNLRWNSDETLTKQ